MSELVSSANETEVQTTLTTTNPLSLEEAIPLINKNYLDLLNTLSSTFKFHDELIGPLTHDIKLTNEKLTENKYQVLDTITDNFLFCLEQIHDHNSDYFIYQKEKVQKKNGKSYKNKLPKIGNRTLLKRVLKDSDAKLNSKIFKSIVDMFLLLTHKDDNVLYFNDDYIEYVKENYTDNKNFSKMLTVFDNADNILNFTIDESFANCENDDIVETDEENEKTKSKGKSKSKKGKGKKDASIGPDFMKGLENTKIAQLAKNISEKINIDDFPSLTDPTKILSSLTNQNEEGGIQNLLKFVIGEVENAFKTENINESDLVNEAQNIMGQFKNASGFDPMSLLSGAGGKDGGIDFSNIADIFANMNKK